MTDSDQLIALAGLAGKDLTCWRFRYVASPTHPNEEPKWSPSYSSLEDAVYWAEKESHWSTVSLPQSFIDPQAAPRYLDSLDAIVPLVRTLRGAELMEYTHALQAAVLRRWTAETGGVPELADARHVAEALLRTKGLWKDSQ